ncbi:MAG: LamB/YcsF family protein, partial [Marinobacter sp.]
MTQLLLNADVGESLGPWVMGNDAALMPMLDLANIA